MQGNLLRRFFRFGTAGGEILLDVARSRLVRSGGESKGIIAIPSNKSNKMQHLASSRMRRS